MEILSVKTAHVSSSDRKSAISAAKFSEQNAVIIDKFKSDKERKLNLTAKPSVESPDALKDSDNKELAAESDAVIAEFFGSNEQRKLEMLENLPAHGKGLKILDEILRIDSNSIVKIAAVSRLNAEHNEATTNLLLRTLDDSASEVSVIALNTLISSGDPALAPILTEKMHSLPEGAIKNFYAESLQRLDMSITMGIDNLTQQ